MTRRLGCTLASRILVLGVLGFCPQGGRADDAPPALGYPIALAATPDGTLYIADGNLRAVVKRDEKGALSILARSGAKDRTPLRALRALAAEPDGSILAADSATRDIYRVRAGEPPKPLTGGELEIPTGIAVEKDGSIIACDLRLGNVVRIAKEGGKPSEIARVPAPRGVALAPDGEIVVLCSGPNQVLRINAKGEVRTFVAGKPFKFPLAIATVSQGDSSFVVSDGDAATVWSVSDKGEVRALSKGAPLIRPEGLIVESSGALLVADPGANQIFRITPDGKPVALSKTP